MTPTHNPLTDLLVWLYRLPTNEIGPLVIVALVIWLLVAITPAPVVRVRGERFNHKGRGYYYQDVKSNRSKEDANHNS